MKLKNFVGIMATFFVAFYVTPGCGNAPNDRHIEDRSDTVVKTDTGTEQDSGNTPDSFEDARLTKGELKQKVCSECEDRSMQCPDEMNIGKGDIPSDTDISALADQYCQDKSCPNPESDEGEPCDDPCAQEREVKCYAWDCPGIVKGDEHDNTYHVEIKDGKCIMDNEHDDMSPWHEEDLSWKYDGGNTMKRHNSANGKYVTCTGELVKDDGPVCGNL